MNKIVKRKKHAEQSLSYSINEPAIKRRKRPERTKQFSSTLLERDINILIISIDSSLNQTSSNQMDKIDKLINIISDLKEQSILELNQASAS